MDSKYSKQNYRKLRDVSDDSSLEPWRHKSDVSTVPAPISQVPVHPAQSALGHTMPDDEDAW